MNIGGYDNYRVTRAGGVINATSGHTMTNQVNNCGYHRVELSKLGKQQRYFVHRLVAAALIPNPNNLPQVNHINGNKLDNRVENLEWCTASYNHKHSYKYLNRPVTRMFDTDNVGTKIKMADIPALIERKKTTTYRALAKELGVHPKYLSPLLRGITARG